MAQGAGHGARGLCQAPPRPPPPRTAPQRRHTCHTGATMTLLRRRHLPRKPPRCLHNDPMNLQEDQLSPPAPPPPAAEGG